VSECVWEYRGTVKVITVCECLGYKGTVSVITVLVCFGVQGYGESYYSV
jgi:hypothetical protein